LPRIQSRLRERRPPWDSLRGLFSVTFLPVVSRRGCVRRSPIGSTVHKLFSKLHLDVDRSHLTGITLDPLPSRIRVVLGRKSFRTTGLHFGSTFCPNVPQSCPEARLSAPIRYRSCQNASWLPVGSLLDRPHRHPGVLGTSRCRCLGNSGVGPAPA